MGMAEHMEPELQSPHREFGKDITLEIGIKSMSLKITISSYRNVNLREKIHRKYKVHFDLSI
jgi:hypothetical protein